MSLPASARRAIALLPVAFAMHVAEEWFGGFPEWTASVVGRAISPERFLLINSFAVPISGICAVASLRSASALWLAASLAALFGLNGVVHSLATLAFAQYSPGTVTGLLLYIPLSVHILRQLASQLPGVLFWRAVSLGIVAHAAVVILAYQ